MNQLADAITEYEEAHGNLAQTANGAVTLVSSKDTFVDLFSMVGAARNHQEEAVRLFKDAYWQDSKLAMRILLWARDARGGAGERAVFRALVQWLSTNGRKVDVINLISSGKIEELGRWDDYIGLMAGERVKTEVREAAATRCLAAINAGNNLVCKWLPRKGAAAAKIRTLFKMSPTLYRKTLVNGTKVVETQMCAKDWEGIRYEHVPSVAMARYTNAFGRNSLTAYPAYVEALVSGEVKAKANALFPYDVARTVKHGDATVANEQWKALPNFIESDARLLPIIDVSGSMVCKASGSVTAMDVAVTLGIYLAERNQSAFKDMFVTFDDKPAFVKIREGSIAEKIHQVQRADWGGSTNLQAAFDLLLLTAMENRVHPTHMPTHLFIVSDMEFNEATTSYSWDGLPDRDQTNYALVEQRYAAAGYERPVIIFWNVNARGQNIQVAFDENRTAMISGFSPSIVRPVLNADASKLTPRSLMMDTIMVPRYDVTGLTA